MGDRGGETEGAGMNAENQSEAPVWTRRPVE